MKKQDYHYVFIKGGVEDGIVYLPTRLWDEIGRPKKARIEMQRNDLWWKADKRKGKALHFTKETPASENLKKDVGTNNIRLTVYPDRPENLLHHWPRFLHYSEWQAGRGRADIVIIRSKQIYGKLFPLRREEFPLYHPKNRFPVTLDTHEVDGAFQMVIHQPQKGAYFQTPNGLRQLELLRMYRAGWGIEDIAREFFPEYPDGEEKLVKCWMYMRGIRYTRNGREVSIGEEWEEEFRGRGIQGEMAVWKVIEMYRQRKEEELDLVS